jgi:hypothetical protein
MKKIVLIFSFFCCRFLSGSAQEIIMDTTPEIILHAYEMKESQWQAWQSFDIPWRTKQYPKILRENKLKLSCSGCENVYMDVVINIDAHGKLTDYRLLGSNKCGEEFSKALEIRFMKWFFQQQFPQELFGTRFQVRLGTGLKC